MAASVALPERPINSEVVNTVKRKDAMGRIHDESSFFKMNCLLLGAPNSVQWVLAALMWHRNRRTGQCNPRIATLATELHLGERTVKRAVRWLKQTGILTGRNQGHPNESYRIAPQTEWQRLIESAKSGTLESARNGTLQSAKMALSKVPKWHSLGSVSINELEKRTRKENRECSAQLANRVATSTEEHAAPKNGICKTEEKPPDPELNWMVDGLAKAMLPSHPRPGRPRAAKTALRNLLCNVTSEERIAIAERIQDSLEAWNEYWGIGALKKKPPFVPMFSDWIESGDWETLPSEWQLEAIRKAPNRELTFEEKLDRVGRNDA